MARRILRLPRVCQFCDRQDTLVVKEIPFEFFNGTIGKRFLVECSGCSLAGPVCLDEQEAIKYWKTPNLGLSDDKHNHSAKEKELKEAFKEGLET